MRNSLKEWGKGKSLEEPEEVTTRKLEKSERFSPQLKEKLEDQSDNILKQMENSYQRLEKVLKAFNRIR